MPNLVNAKTILPPHAGLAQELITDFTLCLSKSKTKGTALPANPNFEPVDSLNFEDEKTGVKAFAFRSKGVDGTKSELRLMFPGHSNEKESMAAENTTAIEIIQGRQSPQVDPIKKYLQEKVIPYLKNNPDLDVHIFGHSMGAGNALTAKHMLDDAKIAVTATIFEPLASPQTARFIIQDASRGKPPEAQAEAFERLQRNITTVRSYPRTAIAKLSIGNSTLNNKAFGEKVFFLNKHPEMQARDELDRRDYMGLGIIDAAFRSAKDEKNAFREPGHTLRESLPLLTRLGGQGIQSTYRTVTSFTQLQNPNFPPLSFREVNIKEGIASYLESSIPQNQAPARSR